MSDLLKYRSAIKAIKDAILISQYESVVSINEKQLILYASVGKYISDNTRNGFWGLDAIRVISEQLQKELPGLRGFSERNLKNMRGFFEEWKNFFVLPQIESGLANSADASAEITIKDCNFKMSSDLQKRYPSSVSEVPFSARAPMTEVPVSSKENSLSINDLIAFGFLSVFSCVKSIARAF